MKKKQIAFFIYDLRCGGIEKALIDLLKKIDYQKYQVDLIVFFEQGQFFNDIPSEVNVICYKLDQFVSMHIDGHIKKDLVFLLKQCKFVTFIKAFFLLFIERVFFNKERWEFVSKIFLKQSKALPKDYDVAIDFQGLGSSILGLPMVAEKIKSHKKITWIHQDINYISKESKKFAHFIQKFDHVFCVSLSAKDAFLKEFPGYTNKTDVFYNVIDKERILTLSEEPIISDNEKDVLKILSVGRLDYQKGFDIAIKCLARIKDRIPRFVYKIVGGGDRVLNDLQNLTEELGIKENVEFLGRQDNPYPYYKEAGIYLQPSRFEGFCITLAEAKLFGLPIVTTDFAGAREQIVNMETGIITECNEDKLSEALIELISSKELQEKFTSNLNKFEHLESELQKLYNIFDFS